MADKRGIQMVDKKHTKTERQLLLYEIIFTSRIIEIEDIVNRLSVNKKTVFRDIRDLRCRACQFNLLEKREGLLKKRCHK